MILFLLQLYAGRCADGAAAGAAARRGCAVVVVPPGGAAGPVIARSCHIRAAQGTLL